MAGPYLKSGESIILTTDRVLIDDIEYDVILTSQRLALVDSGHTSDQPQVVLFASILSVKGGTTPAREPFITLTVIDPNGLEDSKILDLIFSQQPYEDRSAECDLWVQKLIEHIVSIRQEPAPVGKQQALVKSPGMHPTVRRFEAPEVPRPHSQVAQKSRRPSEDLLSALQVSSRETPDNEIDEPAARNDQIPPDNEYSVEEQETGPEIPAPSIEEVGTVSTPIPIEPVDLIKADTFGENTDVHGEVPPVGVSSPASVQDDEGVKTPKNPDTGVIPTPPSDELVPGVSGGEPESSVPARPDDGPVKEEPGLTDAMGPVEDMATLVPILPKTPLHPENPPEPEIPTTSVQNESAGLPAGEPDELSADKGTGEPALPEETPGLPAGAAPDHTDDADIPRPDSGIQTGLPDTVVFPVISDTDLSVAPETPPVKTPPVVQAPARQPPVLQSEKIPVRVTIAIVLVLLVIIGGMAILLMNPAGNTKGSDYPVATPTLTPLPITTAAPVVIPAEGVWVKVMYNGTYYGEYGNPGDLKEVRGTGEQIYAIKNGDALVQASFRKLDYSGDRMTVEVYNNGTMVTQVTKRAPSGTIAILVDPKTGNAPYVPVTSISP
ncbi:hypothetical protein [Methanoregula sp.]|uniref:hypothetical protein n=1 Tax=Methanoregula sp. TaxID=2052170 RepID=UPI0035642D63